MENENKILSADQIKEIEYGYRCGDGGHNTLELIASHEALRAERQALIEMECDRWRSESSKTGYAVGWQISKDELMENVEKAMVLKVKLMTAQNEALKGKS